MTTWNITTSDCRNWLRDIQVSGVLADAIVTDPPYELGFMGKKWDSTGIAYDRITWEAARAAVKPGAHLVAFGGDRTHHRMMVAIEDAGWEIRGCCYWLFGSGFPKSHDVSKAIDKKLGADREVVGRSNRHPSEKQGQRTGGGVGSSTFAEGVGMGMFSTAPATPQAKQWEGWGSALKPASEVIIIARNPLDGTIAENVMRHGCGGINIDGCRIGTSKQVPASGRQSTDRIYNCYGAQDGSESGHNPNVGRWPPTVALDEEAARLLDEHSGNRPGMSGGGKHKEGYGGGMFGSIDSEHTARGDSGGPSRFFKRADFSAAERDDLLFHYSPKASREEREAGLEKGGLVGSRANNHPTVKPISLMRWLVRLITPPGGLVLDPFTGSGTTGIAAVKEGCLFQGCDISPEYTAIARARIAHWEMVDIESPQLDMFAKTKESAVEKVSRQVDMFADQEEETE